MSIGIYQVPAEVSLAQSPLVFAVRETNTVNLTSSSFQYMSDLYYWTGSVYNSGSVPQYQLVKYPNLANTGIFEISPIINSVLRQLAQANPSNVYYFALDAYSQYIDSVTGAYVTGSHYKSPTYKALDGYGLFPEQIGQQISTTTPYWPVMTSGPSTQSVFINNYGSGSVYGDYSNTPPATRMFYSSSVGTAYFNLVGSSTSTSGQVVHYPEFPATPGFPLTTTGLTSYTITPYSASVQLGASIQYNVDCIQKYPNIRIKWKNRFGQFDYFNFYMVNRKSFNTTRKTYQPQLGSWQASSLTYNSYDSQTLNYIVDSKQAIQVNTFWISEDYNDIFKELLVSDEMYWVTDEATDTVKPITIIDSSIQFKTSVVDKLIQYAFSFNFGQNYKLII